MEQDERRRFFRINDLLHLQYKPIKESDVKPSYVTDNILSNFSLSVVLEMMTEDTGSLLSRIEASDPDVAALLAIQDKRLNLLTQYILRHSDDKDSDPLRNLNISASGLSFESSEKLKVKDFLELRVLLPITKSIVVVCAEIVRVVDNKESKTSAEHPYVIRVKFLQLKIGDQELLIKYVVKKQMEQIREVKQKK